MRKLLLTEPEKYIKALLQNDSMRRQQEETLRLLAEREDGRWRKPHPASRIRRHSSSVSIAKSA
jgi:hypothetical protein